MKKILCILLAVLMLISLTACGGGSEEKRSLADEYMNYFVLGQYEKMMSFELSDDVKSQISVDMLNYIWSEYLVSQYGKFVENKGFTGEDKSLGMNLYYYTLAFEGYEVVLAVGVNNKNEISSFTIGQVTGSAKVAFSEGIKATEVTFGESGYKLNGSVIRKEGITGDTAAVIIVGGSGPTERYGSVAANATYADLANALAEKGITVLCYDKRTYTYASKIASDMSKFTVYDEYVEDIKYAYEFMSSYEGVDKDNIYIIGHSQGGYVLPIADEIMENKPKGYIFLNAPYAPIEELLLYQIGYLANYDGEIDESEQVEIASYRQQVENVKSLTEETKNDYAITDLLNASASYWLSLKDYDAAESASKIKSKMFFAFGGHDYQVPYTQMDDYKAAIDNREDVVFKLYENMCHLLFDTANSKPYPTDYNKKTPINENLINDIVEFIMN